MCLEIISPRFQCCYVGCFVLASLKAVFKIWLWTSGKVADCFDLLCTWFVVLYFKHVMYLSVLLRWQLWCGNGSLSWFSEDCWQMTQPISFQFSHISTWRIMWQNFSNFITDTKIFLLANKCASMSQTADESWKDKKHTLTQKWTFTIFTENDKTKIMIVYFCFSSAMSISFIPSMIAGGSLFWALTEFIYEMFSWTFHKNGIMKWSPQTATTHS